MKKNLTLHFFITTGHIDYIFPLEDDPNGKDKKQTREVDPNTTKHTEREMSPDEAKSSVNKNLGSGDNSHFLEVALNTNTCVLRERGDASQN